MNAHVEISKTIISKKRKQKLLSSKFKILLFYILGGTRVGGIYIPPPVKPYCSTDSKGPRLVITHIVNTNFKSYANKVSVGPFHHVSLSLLNLTANNPFIKIFTSIFRDSQL